jgi:hypothetical protein
VNSPIGDRTMENLMETLGKDLAKHNTHPGLKIFLLSRLLEWKTRTPGKALRKM